MYLEEIPLSAAVDPTHIERKPASRGKAIGMMLLCTLLGAAGQVLIKMGAASLHGQNPIAMVLNPQIFAGYALYGMMTVLFVFALREEELSILYPIIALTYVWVAGLAVYFFHEHLNVYKLIGVAAIVAGVGVLGRSGGGKL